MHDLTLIKMAGNLARYAAARQSLVAQNIANADTPGYKARDMESFAKLVDGQLPPLQMRKTHAAHVSGASGETGGFVAHKIAAFGAANPNGNTVTLEDQMMRSAATQRQHDLALGVYSKAMSILRMTLGRR